MHAVASRGRIGGVEFTNAEINSADLRDAVFAARGSTATDAGRAVRMLQATPLAPSFGTVFPDLVAAGPVQANVALFLPIKELERRVVTVQAELAGVTLRHRGNRSRRLTSPAACGCATARSRRRRSPAVRSAAAGRLRSRPPCSGTATCARA